MKKQQFVKKLGTAAMKQLTGGGKNPPCYITECSKLTQYKCCPDFVCLQNHAWPEQPGVCMELV